MAKDASYLGNEYKEESVWHPCLDQFFRSFKPVLPIYEIVASGSDRAFRRRNSLSLAGGTLTYSPRHGNLLRVIGAAVGATLRPEQFTDSSSAIEYYGIEPDFVYVEGDTVAMIEVKPHDGSRLYHNQRAGMAYSRFVKRLREVEVSLDGQYLIAMPIEGLRKDTDDLFELQNELGRAFGFIAFEDIFRAMAAAGFHYGPISEPWSEYVELGSAVVTG